MPTIAFATCEIHPTTRGGAGVFVHHAARELLARGDEVVLLLDLDRRTFDRFRDGDLAALGGGARCRAYHVGELVGDLAGREEDPPTRAIHQSARWARAVAALLAREKVDLIEFYDFSGPAYHTLVARAFGRLEGGPPIAVRLHTTLDLIDAVGGTRYLNLDRYSMYALERGALRLAEAVVVPSRAFFEEVCRERYGIAPERVVVSTPAKGQRAATTSAGAARRVLFVGRLFQMKGVDQFVLAGVEVLRRRPDANVIFEALGSDSSESPLGESYAAHLRSLIPSAMRDRFVFPGHVPAEEVERKYADALACVFPSRLESFGYALHEAYDAGVPIIANDLPAFREFFTHERNALIYDGTTTGLVGAIERLMDDGALRAGLRRPNAVATGGLGEFYRVPRALSPVISANGAPVRALVVVLGRDGADATRRALAMQRHPADRVAYLQEASAGEDDVLWLLGRAWRALDEAGRAIPAFDLRSLDALAVLRGGDRPGAEWLGLGVRALEARADAGFAGTWGTREGRVASNAVDLMAEAWPFERGGTLTRMLVRTPAGLALMDVFDPAFGALGEIALLWQAVGRVGPGLVLPEAHLELAVDPSDPPDANLLKHLLARHGGAFAERLRVYAGLLFERAQAARAGGGAGGAGGAGGGGMHADPSLEHKLSVAEQLGGRTLFKLAWRKALRRARGQAPPT